jgi:uncharacterized membrane protein YccC
MSGKGELVPDRDAVARWEAALANAAQAAGPPLLFGLRLWGCVCLAIFFAFWLKFPEPNWAGLGAAIACLPVLGPSLRKGGFLMIGTVVGAVVVVVLAGFFPQNGFANLGLLAVWGGICAFGATVLRNFASYAAASAGFNAVLIACASLGQTGGGAPHIFLATVTRASTICLGAVCAIVVAAVTDLGGARRQLAASFANLAAEIAGRFARTLALAGPQLPETQTERRELGRRVIALDPMIDDALGESTYVRYHGPILQGAVHGLFRALAGWRGVASLLRRLPADMDRQQAQTILHSISPELRRAREPTSPAAWLADPLALRRMCEEAVRRLLALSAGTPSLRLLADETAKVLAGLLHALDGLALLVDAPGYSLPGNRGFRLGIADWLPPLINAVRAFLTIGAAALFWVTTAWPDGATAIIFAAVVVCVFAPRGELAYGGAMVFTLGAAGAVVCAAIVNFAVLPGLDTFPAFCAAMGLVLVPVGFATAWSRKPAVRAVFTVWGILFVPILGPRNQMTYDPGQFYNFALAALAGCLMGALSFLLLPSLSPALRVRRLLALTLRDLRRLAMNPRPPSSEDWESRIYGRLAALPQQVEPLQLGQLLAALSVGTEIVQLRRMAPRLGVAAQLDAALEALAQGNGAIAIAKLGQLDQHLASAADGAAEIALRARAHILGLSEAITAHGRYFDSGAPA